MQRYIHNHPIGETCVIKDVNQRRHITDIRQLKTGDHVVVCERDGACFWMMIASIRDCEVTLNRVQALPHIRPGTNLNLAQALIRPDHFNLVRQKAFELGVDTVYPIITERTVSPLEPRSHGADALHEAISLKDLDLSAFDAVLVAHENEHQQTLFDALATIDSTAQILLLIGPEGGFSDADLKHLPPHATYVTLGEKLLRSETAAIFAVSIIIHERAVMKR